MRNVLIIGRREFSGYFVTPLAYVFIFIFLVLAGVLTFYLGGFYERAQADLEPFFSLHPWLYLLLIPALSMRTWAEEKRSGSIELLLTHPVRLIEAVLGKFLATWGMAALALALTFPLWITVNYLGEPDNGAILAGYIGSLLMAGGFLAIGSCMSALTASQVVAFILAVVVSLLFLFSGSPLLLDAFRSYAPAPFVDAIASLSFLTHFQSIMKGVVDLRDIVFFATVIAVFLAATAIVLGGWRRAGRVEIAVLAVVFLAVTMLSNVLLRGLRLDLTEHDQYTLAEGSRRIVGALEEPINLYFYYSREAARGYPQLATYGAQVRDFLEELAARSRGKLQLSVIDPQPFSEDEDRAAELGVRALPAPSAGAPPIYFGLAATNATDGREAISFFDPQREEFLEYDVVKLIQQLSVTEKPVVGWISGLPMTPTYDPQTGRMREPNFLFLQAQQLFDLRQLEPTIGAIDPAIDMLVLVHPKRLAPSTLFAIDQFALRGGRVLAFVDPLADADRSGMDEMGGGLPPGAVDRSSTLEPLLAAWGVQFNPGEVIVDPAHGMEVGLMPGAPPVRHPAILALDGAALNAKDVVTASLSNIHVVMAGHLSRKPDASTAFEPLLLTSDQAGTVPETRLAMLFDPTGLLDGHKPRGEPLSIAARITGPVKTAFPDGPPPGVALAEGQVPLRESKSPLNAIVVADTDLFADYVWVRVQRFFGDLMAQPFASNGDFVLNAIDNLAGSGDLISLRGRASFTRPFDRVDELKRGAETRFRQKEQELEKELRDTEQKLTELQGEQDGSALLLSPAQQQALENFEAERLRIRKELRAVRAGLDEDIRQLGAWLKFINGVLAPALLVLALGLVSRRLMRRRRA
jgi:ABC-type uncharacterized transport system involved in gliding motility auxiliary subunit/ABC-type transport system involved in cytochrome c biogenesis permease component